MSVGAKILWGLFFILGTALFVENACDNSSLNIWLQGLFAIPCFPWFWFFGYLAGIALILGAFTDEN